MKSISNNKLTLLRKLARKKYRYREQLFLVEGLRSVRQVIENGTVEVKGLFFDESQHLWEQQLMSEKYEAIQAAVVDKNDFTDISDTNNPQGIIALCSMPAETATSTLAKKSGLVLATDAIQDPGNMGTIIRTASWFGVNGLLAGKGSVDLFNPKVVRSTAGATGTIPYQSIMLADALPVFEEVGWNTVLLEVSDLSKPLDKAVPQEKTIIIVGNEANGINPELAAANRTALHINSKNHNQSVESLNAAISVSIALYQLSK